MAVYIRDYWPVHSILFRTRRANIAQLYRKYPNFDPNLFVHTACTKNDLKMLKALVKCGGNLMNIYENKGYSHYPIHLACLAYSRIKNSSKNRLLLITWILSHSDGLSTIDRYCYDGKDYRTYLTKPRDDHPRDDHHTALHIAALTGAVDLIQLLLTYGADPTLCDDSGRTAKEIFKDKCYYNIKVTNHYKKLSYKREEQLCKFKSTINLFECYETMWNAGEWRPWNHGEFTQSHKDCLKTLVILAKSN